MMQICPNCNQEITENFDICWNCGYSFVEGKVVSYEPPDGSVSTFNCLRCNIPMHYKGNYKFHEGSVIGVFTELLVFDLFVCKKCGKVEFFMPSE